MTIREGIAEILKRRKSEVPVWCACYEGDLGDEFPEALELATNQIMEYLKSEGVVKKVERELPENYFDSDVAFMGFQVATDEMLKAGYVCVEEIQ